MGFIKLTLEYIRKNFLYLVFFAVIPSMLYAFNDSPLNVLTFFKSVRENNANFRFDGIYKYFSLINFPTPLVTIATLLSVIFFAAVSAAFIEKHMRIGKKSLKGLIFQLNDNIMPIIYFMLLFAAIYEFWAVLFSAVLSLFSLFISHGLAMYFVGLVLCFAFYWLFFAVLGMFLTWLPCKLITGFGYGEAFAHSISLMPSRIKSIVSIALPYAVGMLISGLTQASFGVTAGYVIRTIVFLFCFMYYNVLVFVAYFDLTKEVREDLKKKYF